MERAREYLRRIRCQQVNLVWGNHDQRAVGPLFGRVIDQGMVRVEGQGIWLNHYPMRSWNKSFHRAWHVYGHVHGRFAREDAEKPWLLTRDVGVDACDYRPVSFDMLREYMRPRIEAFQRRKQDLLDNQDADEQPT